MEEIIKLCKYEFDYKKYDKLLIVIPVWASDYNPTIRTFIDNNIDKFEKIQIEIQKND